MNKQYLVRCKSDGKMRTVVANSVRSAAKLAMNKYKFPDGEVIQVKERGVGDWDSFKVYR